MATAEYVVDAALRKLGIPGHGDVRSTDTSNVSTYINAALRHLNIPNPSDEAADSTETVQNYIDAAMRKLEVVDSTNEGAASTATAKEVSEHALRLIGAIDPAEGGSTGELSDAYDALNRMIREWIADGIYLPNYTDVANDADTVNVPSSAILPIVHNLAGVLAPEYGTQLSETGLSVAINSKNRLRRNPTDHMNELNRMLHDWESERIVIGFSEYSALGDAISMPKNVATAVIDNLTVRLAPEYGKQPPETVLQQAVNEKQDLRKDSSDHLTVLNHMLHEWEATGIDLGFNEYSALTDNVNLPKNAAPAIIHNLAFRLAPEYGREPSQLTVELAQAEKSRLTRKPEDDRSALNDMLLDWEADGINLGFRPVDVLEQNLRVPDNALNPIIYNLAVTLAPDYSAQPRQDVFQRAREGRKRLERDSATEIIMSTSHLPGSKPKRFNIDSID